MNRKILFALILMGFTSLVVQTLLIREFLISFYGNELTIGLILGNWIILEALGSILFSRPSIKSKKPHLVYALFQTGIALYLPLSIFLIRTVKNTLGLTAGEGIGILPIFFSSLFILAPLSFFDGAQFPFGCRILSDARGRHLESAGKVYILEAIGFILAGPIFTYILITQFHSFSIAFFLGLLNLISAVLLLKGKSTNAFSRIFFVLLNTLCLLWLLSFMGPVAKIQQISINKQWQGQEVLKYQNSIYGNLVVAESKGQYTFYSDGIPVITTPVPDIITVEERVHFTLLSHPKAKNILLLSGGAGGVIKEILKYPIEKLTYAELDPLLIKLIKDFPTELTKTELNDRRLEIKHIDGRRFLHLLTGPAAAQEPPSRKYDVIILNLPMPSTLQLNRFYTREFFKLVKSALSEGGIFSFSLPGSLSYLSPQMVNLNGSILNTLKDIFSVSIIPGDFNLYLASADELKVNAEIYLSRLEEKNLKTKLLNKPHLEYRLNMRFRKWFDASLSGYGKLRKNFDLLPTATFYSISYWNTIFSPQLAGLFNLLDKINFIAVILVLAITGLSLLLLEALLPKARRRNLAIGLAITSTGFMGMSLDLLIIYTYQACYGFVFSHLALLVTAFMSGLTIGGLMMNKKLMRIKNNYLSFLKIECLIFILCLAAGPLLLYLSRFSSLRLASLFFLASVFSGFLVGAEFPLANKICGEDKVESRTAGMLYALDLAGAWLAALMVSVMLVPVIGIFKTCIFLAVLKIISLIGVVLARD